MCRLFGLTAAPHRVHARFWLLEAPDSLSQQSRQNADGTGLGIFSPDGAPVLDKQPVAAYQDIALRRRSPAPDVDDVHRPCAEGVDRRTGAAEYASVRDGGPDHGPQRRHRRPAEAGAAAR
jgi:hypothetical protein